MSCHSLLPTEPGWLCPVTLLPTEPGWLCPVALFCQLSLVGCALSLFCQLSLVGCALSLFCQLCLVSCVLSLSFANCAWLVVPCHSFANCAWLVVPCRSLTSLRHRKTVLVMLLHKARRCWHRLGGFEGIPICDQFFLTCFLKLSVNVMVCESAMCVKTCVRGYATICSL